MIVGTGLFTSVGAATAKAGSGVLIAMLIGGLIALSTGISAAQVGVNYPEEGGAFIWLRNFGFSRISFLAGCSYLFEGIIGLGILALGFATYTAQIFPQVPIKLGASLALIAVAVINVFGVSPTAKVLIGVFFLNVVFLGIYVFVGVPQAHFKNLWPVLGSHGVVGVLSGAATFFWTWDGFQRTAIMANTIKKPRTTIPFAVVGGISIAAIIYVLVAGTTLSVLGPEKMGMTDTPIFACATALVGWGGWLIIASAWMTAFSEMLGDLLATSRVGHAMGKEHEIPEWLGAMNKSFHSPHHSLIALTIIGLVLVFFVPLRSLMPVASAFTLVWYGATHYSALQLKEKERFAPRAVSWLGIAACCGLFASLPLWSMALTAGILVFLAGTRWSLAHGRFRPT